jgi:hypothetical protein
MTRQFLREQLRPQLPKVAQLLVRLFNLLLKLIRHESQRQIGRRPVTELT